MPAKPIIHVALTFIPLKSYMWYVVQTLKGTEDKVLANILRDISEEQDEAFILENERMYRIKGKWIKDRKPLFPGYLFVETADPTGFDVRLRRRYRPTKLLRMDGDIASLKPEEEEYLKLLGGKEHIVRYSEGYRRRDKVVITSGAFEGYRGEIKKLDRHNRVAWVELPFLGQMTVVEIGLGIVKSED